MSSSGKKEIMTYLEIDMPACVGGICHHAAYLKTRAQLFNRRKSRNKKLKALRCLQVNTYFGRMKHWPATQSSSSTADASIDNDERYAYRDGQLPRAAAAQPMRRLTTTRGTHTGTASYPEQQQHSRCVD